MDIIHDDYFKLRFQPGTFDGIITDIPYKGCIKKKLHEDAFSFTAFLEKTDEETADDAFLITFTNFLCAMDLMHHARGTRWTFHTHQVWDKRPVRTWISWGHPLRHTEYILYFKKGNFKFTFKTGETNPPYSRRSFGGSMKTTYPNTSDRSHAMFPEIVTYACKGKRRHPAEKPVEFSHLFRTIVGGEKRVLDPFAGTGNLICAFQDATGVDLDMNYCTCKPVHHRDVPVKKRIHELENGSSNDDLLVHGG